MDSGSTCIGKKSNSVSQLCRYFVINVVIISKQNTLTSYITKHIIPDTISSYGSIFGVLDSILIISGCRIHCYSTSKCLNHEYITLNLDTWMKNTIQIVIHKEYLVNTVKKPLFTWNQSSSVIAFYRDFITTLR